LRILSESWGANKESLTVSVSGIPGRQYDLALWNSGQVASLDGGKLIAEENGETRIRVELPGTDSSSYVHGKFVVHFTPERSDQATGKKSR
jgi:hypothetical protein